MSNIQDTPAPPAGPLWYEEELQGWHPLEDLSTIAWAEKYRSLDRRQTKLAWSGAFRVSRQPATIGFLLLLDRRDVQVLTVAKHSQGGWSEAARNWLARLAHLEPDPFLLVLPNKPKGRSIIRHRLLPIFDACEPLKRLRTSRKWDLKSDEILLSNGFTLRLGYSGSIDSVASDPARYVLNDERSKFTDDGKVSIEDSIEARTTTYGDDKKIVNLSTPGAHSDDVPDPIWRLFQTSPIKMYRHVACPHCGTWQRLVWDNLHWTPKKEDEPDRSVRAARVVAERSAWFACENPTCAVDHPESQGRFDDRHRPAMLANAYWGTIDGAWKIWDDGREEGTKPPGGRVGMHAPAWISMADDHRWFKVAERWILAEGDVGKLRGFYNEIRAEPFIESVAPPVAASIILKKCLPDPETGFVPPKARVLPRWAARLTMHIDTQKDHFWWTIRCWGAGLRSRRVAHGKALNFEQIEALADQAYFPYEDNIFAARRVWMTAIDSGGGTMGLDSSRTDQVYRWCLKDPTRRFPFKGRDRTTNQPIYPSPVTYRDPRDKSDPFKLYIYLVDVNHYQDLLASQINEQIPLVDPDTGELLGNEDLWQLNDEADPEYARHLVNMKKVVIRARGGKKVLRWIPASEGARVDYRDTEVYALALADGPAQCGFLPTFEMMRGAVQTAQQPAVTGITTPDGRAFLASQRK